MSLACLLTFTLALAPAQRAFQGERAESTLVQRGRIAWYQGSYEELLAEAARSKRLVFLDFYSRLNAYSKKLEQGTYMDPRVVAEVADLLCYSVDTDSKASKPLRRRFQVQSAPTLVFLDPDGELRDQISGYIPADLLLQELCRIKANRGTFSDLRGRIEADAEDLDARWELGCKLRKIGDLAGYEQQVAEIREHDPEGRSMASRRMRLSLLYTAATQRLDLDPLYEFVQNEHEPALRLEGWWSIWTLEGQAARSAGSAKDRRRHQLLYFAAARALWPLVPPEQHGRLGNNIAWSIYESRESAMASDLEFALEVATKAAAAAPDVPAVVDTLACCLYAAGRRKEALTQVERCIRLDPQNPEWRQRLEEFLP